MALELNWVGEPDYPRVAQTRFRCYSPSGSLRQKFEDSVRLDGRQKPGDFLLATRDGIDVGTATSLSLNIWLRGARLPCQGVAYVGTIKTGRRGGSTQGEKGVASAVMIEMLRMARERGDALSALMPFRGSFYEHFGYGNAESRAEWTVATPLLPRGGFDGYRFFDPATDHAKILQLRQREAAQGQCDVETDDAAWKNWQRSWDAGLGFVDQPIPGGPVEAYCYALEERGTSLTAPPATLNVEDWGVASPDALRRMLHFFASLKDQYGFIRIQLPSHLPLNRLLRESQIPHRQADHAFASARPFTRMQIRLLDHRRVLEAMTLATTAHGKANVTVGECEGTQSRLAIDFDGSKLTVKPATGPADVEVSDVLWASIVSGDLRASAARDLGLIRATSAEAIALLDAFSAGPAPFCQEYF